MAGASVLPPQGDDEHERQPTGYHNCEGNGKKTLDPHLSSGAKGIVNGVRVQSGYPLWNLVDAWIATGHDDEALIRDYRLDPVEWAADKQYYLDHKPIIDARIIANTQPDANDDVPPLHTG